jgi:hypothetical protein
MKECMVQKKSSSSRKSGVSKKAPKKSAELQKKKLSKPSFSDFKQVFVKYTIKSLWDPETYIVKPISKVKEDVPKVGWEEAIENYHDSMVQNIVSEWAEIEKQPLDTEWIKSNIDAWIKRLTKSEKSSKKQLEGDIGASIVDWMEKEGIEITEFSVLDRMYTIVEKLANIVIDPFFKEFIEKFSARYPDIQSFPSSDFPKVYGKMVKEFNNMKIMLSTLDPEDKEGKELLPRLEKWISLAERINTIYPTTELPV